MTLHEGMKNKYMWSEVEATNNLNKQGKWLKNGSCFQIETVTVDSMKSASHKSWSFRIRVNGGEIEELKHSGEKLSLIGTLVPVQEVFFQENANRSKVDILWVVDNSGSMKNEQEALANNFEIFINDFIDRNLDFNMAVTTTGKIIGNSKNPSAYQSDDRYKVDDAYFFVDYDIMEGEASLLTFKISYRNNLGNH